MPGRPRKPLKIHKLDGSFRADRHAKPSIAKQTATGAPPMPKGLGAAGKAMWELVVTTRRDWLAQSDAPALASMCEMWDLRCKALKLVKEQPCDKLIRTAFVSYHQEWSKMATKFGLSPIDRAKIGEQTADEIDPAAEFIA